MTRFTPFVAVAVAAVLTLAGGAVAAALGSALNWNPVIAPAALIVPVAAFALTCRGRDVVEAFAASFAVAYAGYLGLAAVRAAHADLVFTALSIAPISALWPAIVLAGIPFALIYTVAIALPASRIPTRTGTASDAEAFWNAIAECRERAALRHRARE
jgi:hypothetical protein